MSDGGAQRLWFGPYFDDDGAIYRGIKVLVTTVGTTNAKTYWTDEAKANAVNSGVLTDADNDGIASAFFDGDYRFRVTQSDDSALDNAIDWDATKVTSDTATMWEGNFGSTFPSATTANRWQLFAKNDGSNNFQQLGINEGSAFKILIDSTNIALDSQYADLDAAVTAIGATETTLRIQSAMSVGGTPTTPETLTLVFDRGGSLDFGAGETVTINGQLHAEPFQIFDSADLGDVDLSGSKIPESYPEWWGIDGTADEVEINKAIRAVGNYKKVTLANPTYTTADPIVISGATGVILEKFTLNGNGAKITSTSTTDIMTVGNADNASAVQFCNIQNIYLATTNTGAMNGIKLIGAFTGFNYFNNINIGSSPVVSPQTDSVGILLLPGGLGDYRNRWENISIDGFDYGMSLGYDFDNSAWATQSPNRQYFDNLSVRYYDTYGVYVGWSTGSEIYSFDFENSNGAGAKDLYIAYQNGGTNQGANLKAIGTAETQSTVAVEIESGTTTNWIVMNPHGKTITDNNNSDNKNTIFSNVNDLNIDTATIRNIAPFSSSTISLGDATGMSLLGDGSFRLATTGSMVLASTIKTFTDSDTTPDVSASNVFNTNTSGVTISQFDNGIAGQHLILISKGAIVFDTSTATRLIGSSVDITTASGDTTMWVCETGGTSSSVWRLLSWIDVSKDNSVTT